MNRTQCNALNTTTLVLGLCLAFILSAALRLWLFDGRSAIKNIEASYHVLFTDLAYDRTPVTQHAFLPLNSFGGEMDKGIAWGATWPGPHGNFYYASFAAPGFVLPYLWFKLLGQEPNLYALLWLNLLIHGVSAGLMALLLWRALPDAALRTRWFATLCGGAFYLFANEALYSHGPVYWHHSLFQPVWLLQLLTFQTLLREGERPTSRTLRRLWALAFVLPLIEWAGYLANIVMAALLWRRKRMHIGKLPLSFALIAAIAAACALYLVHYVAVIGWAELQHALLGRFHARSLASSYTSVRMQIGLFWRGYLESYGLPAVMAAILGLREIMQWRNDRALNPLRVLLLAAAFPLIENLVLMQHAVSYSFDRLKALPLLILLLGSHMASHPSPAWRRAFSALLIIGIAGNAALFTAQKRVTPMHAQFAQSEATLAALRAYEKPCMLYAVRGWVRGWVSMNLQHGSYENITTPEQVRKLAMARNACGVIWLQGEMQDEAIYGWTDAVIFDAARDRFVSAKTGRMVSEFTK